MKPMSTAEKKAMQKMMKAEKMPMGGMTGTMIPGVKPAMIQKKKNKKGK